MATVLDLSLLKSFDIIFPVLLVFAIVFAILQKTKALGESLQINAIVAVAIAFMVLLSDTLVKVLNFMIPWFTVIIIFFILVLLIFQVFGASETDIRGALGDKTLQWTLIGVGIVLLVASLGTVLGQSFTDAAFDESGNVTITDDGGVAQKDFMGSARATLFHPKVLGMVIIFLIAIFAVAFLSGG